MIRVDGEYKYESRVIAERILGRSLLDNEVIHHFDEDNTNNNPKNLIVMDKDDHLAHHRHGIFLERYPFSRLYEDGSDGQERREHETDGTDQDDRDVHETTK